LIGRAEKGADQVIAMLLVAAAFSSRATHLSRIPFASGMVHQLSFFEWSIGCTVHLAQKAMIGRDLLGVHPGYALAPLSTR
jgi:hypothetical protein